MRIPKSSTRTNTLDRFNRIVQVLEGGSGGFTTTYAYDTLNDVTTVDQTGTAGTLQRNFTYSSLARLDSADNPETRSGSSTIQYTYDSNGNISSRMDTNSVKATYSYDPLNRVCQKAYSGTASTITLNQPAPTPNVGYYYDGNTPSSGAACIAPPSASYNTGHLTAVTTSSGSTTQYTFDPFGNFSTSQQGTGGGTFPFSYTYDLAGNLTSVTYPGSNRTLTYMIDQAGRTSAVSGSISGGSPTSYGTVTAFAPHGAIQALSLNNNLTNPLIETTSFNARLQPLSIATMQGSTNMLTLVYNYCADFSDTSYSVTCASNNGNVTRQQIGFGAIASAPAFAETQVYQYNDRANRLTQSSGAPTPTASANWVEPNGFDAVGNRWVVQSGVQNLTVAPETPVASSWFTAQNRINSWNYDAMGNLTGSLPNRTFVYDGENRQVQATMTGSVSTYTYDGDGRRVMAVTPNGTTTFVYDAEGRLAQEYSTAAPVATGTTYLTVDHLGSTRLATDANGNVLKRYDYLPFGEELTVGTDGRTSSMGYNTALSATNPDVQPMKLYLQRKR